MTAHSHIDLVVAIILIRDLNIMEQRWAFNLLQVNNTHTEFIGNLLVAALPHTILTSTGAITMKDSPGVVPSLNDTPDQLSGAHL